MFCPDLVNTAVHRMSTYHFCSIVQDSQYQVYTLVVEDTVRVHIVHFCSIVQDSLYQIYTLVVEDRLHNVHFCSMFQDSLYHNCMVVLHRVCIVCTVYRSIVQDSLHHVYTVVVEDRVHTVYFCSTVQDSPYQHYILVEDRVHNVYIVYRSIVQDSLHHMYILVWLYNFQLDHKFVH